MATLSFSLCCFSSFLLVRFGMSLLRYTVQSRVVGLFSSRPNWDHITPSPTGASVSPPLVPGGGARLLAGEGVVGSNSDEVTDTGTLGIYVLCAACQRHNVVFDLSVFAKLDCAGEGIVPSKDNPR
jgi:hypothetical protein